MVSEIFSIENWFLIGIAIVWMVIASIQDFRKREVANWWNFSLTVIALVYRAFLSVVKLEHGYFTWGVIGLIIGIVLSNVFYYARIFGGGDAKLMISLGAILPLSFDWMINLRILVSFLFLFLLFGGLYGIIYSSALAIEKRKKFIEEFIKQSNKYKKYVFNCSILAIVFIVIGLITESFLIFWLFLLLLASTWLLVYAKSIEECCMVKSVSVSDLTIGDWIVKSILIGKKKIKPNWQGLSENELKLIQKKVRRKVLIRYGIPFMPAFLLAFIGVLIVLWLDLSILIF